MGPEAQEVVFVADLASHLADRRVLALEVGRPSTPAGADSRFEDFHEGQAHRTVFMLSEDLAAEYLVSALTGLWEAGAVGAFVYCFADAEPALFQKTPYDERPPERSYGLLRADGSEKPAAAALRKFAKKRHPLQDSSGLHMADLDAQAYYRAPAEAFRVRLADFLG